MSNQSSTHEKNDGEMSISRETATAFVEAHGRTWNAWDISGFCELFSEDPVYVAHPTEATVTGRAALERYVAKERANRAQSERAWAPQ